MRNITLWIVFLAIFIVAGCESKKSTSDGKLQVGFVYVSPVADAGWTWAHDQGRIEMEKLPYIAPSKVREDIKEGADSERSIIQLAESGCNLIFTTSFGYMDPTIKIAAKYPDRVFMHCSGFKTSANTGTYFGRMYEARYLSGLVAGKMTKTNIVGYVAAFPIPEVIRGINAFTLGVRSANPNAQVRVVWTSTWYNVVKEREAAESLLNSNADVIAQHQDSPAAPQAAEKRGKYCVGYNTDMSNFAPNAHLTAPVWNWGKIYCHVASQVRSKTWKSEKIWWGIKDGAVDIAPLNLKIVPEDVAKLVKEARQNIVDGKIHVFKGPIRLQDGKVQIEDGKIPSDEDLLNMNYFVEGVKGSLGQ